MQIFKYAIMQIFKYASMQTCKFAGLKVFNFASLTQCMSNWLIFGNNGDFLGFI